MRTLNTLALMPILALALLMSGCYVEHRSSVSDRHRGGGSRTVDIIPPGGADFGTMAHFDHAFAERTISNSTDLDGFEFRLAETSVVLMSVTGAGGLDAFIDLYHGNFTFIAGDNDGGPGLDPVIVGVFNAGNYFAVVGGIDGTTGDYDFDISVEPLGGVDFGVLTAPDSVIDDEGFLDDEFDIDSFIFTVMDNVVADIYLTGDPTLDTNLQLMNEYGEEIAFVDDPGSPISDIIGQALAPGHYIVRVGTYSGSGGYTLEIDIS
jgi:hypothetical protein